MIVPRTQARLIADSRADTVILPVREYEPRKADFRTKTRLPAEVVWVRGEWRDEDGKLRRSDVLCQVRIGEHERALLHEVDLRTVRRAGFETRGHLAQWWRERYDRVEPPASLDPWPEGLPIEVRVIRVSLDVPVVLKPAAGYAINAPDILSAGEPVPEDYRHALADEARAQGELRHLAKRRREQSARLEELYAEAEAMGVDVTRQAGSIDRQIAAMERKLRPLDEAA